MNATIFVTEKDEAFLSTCRGSRACPVFLTQTLPTLYARMGHTKTAAAQGLIGKFGTIVAHQNACHETNEYISKVIGRDIHQRRNQSKGFGSNSCSATNHGTSASHKQFGEHDAEPFRYQFQQQQYDFARRQRRHHTQLGQQ